MKIEVLSFVVLMTYDCKATWNEQPEINSIQEYGRIHDKFHFLSSRIYTKNSDEILRRWRVEAESMGKNLMKAKLRWSMAFLSPEPHFNWNKVKEIKLDDETENDNNIIRAISNPMNIQSDSTQRNWAKVTILPNRKILVDGKIVEGVLMPFEKPAYLLVSREISHWFSSCLEHENNGSLSLNEACFFPETQTILEPVLKVSTLYLKIIFYHLQTSQSLNS